MLGRFLLLGIVVAVAIFVLAETSSAHLVKLPDQPKRSVLENRLAQQEENVAHCRYVARHGAGRNRDWHQSCFVWVSAEARETRSILFPPTPWYIAAQIRAANHLAANSALDPWPNCPDPGPRDNQGPGHSWHDTVSCENGGQWTDSPGFYRCGLQFDPMWENVYGRLC